MKRLAGCIALLSISSCGAGQSVVDLDVTSAQSLQGIDTLEITATLAGVPSQVSSVPLPAGQTSIPPDAKVALQFDKSRSGEATIHVAALGGGRIIAVGTTSVTLAPSASLTATAVLLGGPSTADMGSSGDLAMVGDIAVASDGALAVADMAVPDLTVIGMGCGGQACNLSCCGAKCVDTATDPMNCGGCNAACSLAGAMTYGCSNGTCAILMCQPGFGDCDKDPKNGCEVDLTRDPANCGACMNVCKPANVGAARCVMSACGYDRCNDGYKDCDGDAANGCETGVQTDVKNCGACANACNGNVPQCLTGDCVCAFDVDHFDTTCKYGP